MKFEEHTYQREADAEEIAHQRTRHIQVLDELTDTENEAKESAKSYRDTLTGLHKQEENLRLNLKNGTVSTTVNVRRQADDEANVMRYFDEAGNEVLPLQRPLTQDESLALFDKKVSEAAKAAKPKKDKRTQAEIDFDKLADEGEKLRAKRLTETEFGEVADYSNVLDNVPTFDPAELDKLQAVAEAKGTLPPKPVKAPRAKKQKPEA